MVHQENPTIDIQPDAHQLASKVAGWLCDLALKSKERFTVSLSGGSTPQVLYATLAAEPFKDIFPWHKVHWFWGDERFVSKTDALSNYKMVYDTMLAKVPVPSSNIHAVDTELSEPEAAAQAYERDLKRYYGADTLQADRPFFDVNFLGLGEDGHTASLFPGTSVLNEKIRWVSTVIGAKSEARITLTYPMLESAKFVCFLVTGKGKRDILLQLKEGNPNLPSAHLQPQGQVYWFLDEAAASLLYVKN